MVGSRGRVGVVSREEVGIACGEKGEEKRRGNFAGQFHTPSNCEEKRGGKGTRSL